MTNLNELSDAELAEKVAVEVMGWRKGKISPAKRFPLKDCYYKTEAQFIYSDDWNPCNDWNDMKQVIWELNKSGYNVEVCNRSDGFKWVDIRGVGGKSGEQHWGKDQEKAGRAIVLAALKAAGVSVE